MLARAAITSVRLRRFSDCEPASNSFHDAEYISSIVWAFFADSTAFFTVTAGLSCGVDGFDGVLSCCCAKAGTANSRRVIPMVTRRIAARHSHNFTHSHSRNCIRLTSTYAQNLSLRAGPRKTGWPWIGTVKRASPLRSLAHAQPRHHAILMRREPFLEQQRRRFLCRRKLHAHGARRGRGR